VWEHSTHVFYGFELYYFDYCVSYWLLLNQSLSVLLSLSLTSWYWWMQPYVVENSVSPGKNYGFNEPLADGIPSLPEYLAEYCDAAVSVALFHSSHFNYILVTVDFFWVQMVDEFLVLLSIHML
jgi:hypothetical protein